MTSLIERLRAWCSPAPAGKSRVVVRIYENGHLTYRGQRDCRIRNGASVYAAANDIVSRQFGIVRHLVKKGKL